jgi:hypothetical protein
MIRLDFSQEIKAPVVRVFNYVTDFRNATQWQEGVVESKPVKNLRTQVGTKVKMVRLLMGERLESMGMVTEFVQNKKFAFKSTSGPVRFSMSQTFSPIHGGTRLETHMEMDPADFVQVSESAVAASLKQQFSVQEQKLKEILETRA